MNDPKKLDLSKVGKLKNSPILKGLPARLKDKGCYAGIEKRLRDATFSDHVHATVKGMVACKRCRGKLRRKQEILKEIGFKSYGQYLEWRRIMTIIISEQNIQLS